MGDRKILVSLTTLAAMSQVDLPGWETKLEEIEYFNLNEIALFLTGLSKEKRNELYQAIEKTSVKSIPHIHIRTDMDRTELDYLYRKYSVKAFNLHALEEFPLQHDYGKELNSILYLENSRVVPDEKDLEEYGGLCVDFAHWEGEKLKGNTEYVQKMDHLVKKIKIGCAHISAIKNEPTPIVIDATKREYDSHVLGNLSELNYLKKYKAYFPEIMSIELENPIAEQLEAKKYTEKIISDKK
jgi:hypothetical protein